MKQMQAIADAEPLAPDAIEQHLSILADRDRMGQTVPEQQDTGLEEHPALAAPIKWKKPAGADRESARRNVKARPDLRMHGF